MQGPLTIWTYHSFFCKYNLGPSLKIEYLKSGWEYQRASFIGLKFGISRITRLWFQVFKWLHLWMVWIWKSGFECKFPAPEGIMKNTKKHPTLPDHCDPTTCSKLDYKVPMERGYPYLSFARGPCMNLPKLILILCYGSLFGHPITLHSLTVWYPSTAFGR